MKIPHSFYLAVRANDMESVDEADGAQTGAPDASYESDDALPAETGQHTSSNEEAHVSETTSLNDGPTPTQDEPTTTSMEPAPTTELPGTVTSDSSTTSSTETHGGYPSSSPTSSSTSTSGDSDATTEPPPDETATSSTSTSSTSTSTESLTTSTPEEQSTTTLEPTLPISDTPTVPSSSHDANQPGETDTKHEEPPPSPTPTAPDHGHHGSHHPPYESATQPPPGQPASSPEPDSTPEPEPSSSDPRPDPPASPVPSDGSEVPAPTVSEPTVTTSGVSPPLQPPIQPPESTPPNPPATISSPAPTNSSPATLEPPEPTPVSSITSVTDVPLPPRPQPVNLGHIGSSNGDESPEGVNVNIGGGSSGGDGNVDSDGSNSDAPLGSGPSSGSGSGSNEPSIGHDDNPPKIRSGERLRPGAIAGIVVGAFLALLGAFLLTRRYHKRRLAQKRQEYSSMNNLEEKFTAAPVRLPRRSRPRLSLRASSSSVAPTTFMGSADPASSPFSYGIYSGGMTLPVEGGGMEADRRSTTSTSTVSTNVRFATAPVSPEFERGDPFQEYVAPRRESILDPFDPFRDPLSKSGNPFVYNDASSEDDPFAESLRPTSF